MFATRLSGGLLAGLIAIALVLPFAHPVACPMYGHGTETHRGTHSQMVVSGADVQSGAVAPMAEAGKSCGDMFDCGIAPVAPVIQAPAAVPLAAVQHADVLPGADVADDNTPIPHTPPPRA